MKGLYEMKGPYGRRRPIVHELYNWGKPLIAPCPLYWYSAQVIVLHPPLHHWGNIPGAYPPPPLPNGVLHTPRSFPGWSPPDHLSIGDQAYSSPTQ